MSPRLKSSTQWTPFPEELSDHICEVFNERFSDEYDLRGFYFVAEGRLFSNEILWRVGLRSQTQLKQHNFELSVRFDSSKQNGLELVREGLNLIEPQFVELLEEDFEDTDFPVVWMPIKDSKMQEPHLRYSTVNTDLETQADAILQEYEKKLVYGEATAEEPSASDEIH